jgi:hypothetical protein
MLDAVEARGGILQRLVKSSGRQYHFLYIYSSNAWSCHGRNAVLCHRHEDFKSIVSTEDLVKPLV